MTGRSHGILAAVLACTLAAMPAAQQPENLTGTAAISGTVVDALTGRPIAGARVYISREPYVAGLPSVSSDGDGHFAFRDLPAGSYTLSGSRGGYLGGAYGQQRPHGESLRLTLTEGRRELGVLVRMWPGGVIKGRVLDDRGAPVTGVSVVALLRQDDGARYTNQGLSGRTDDRGEYRITQLSPGEYVVVVACGTNNGVLTPTLNAAAPTVGRGGYRPYYGGAVQYLVDEPGRTVFLPRCPLLSPTARNRPQAFVTTAAGGPQLREALAVALAMGETRDNVDIHLEVRPATSVSGTITNTAGPLEGAFVQLIPDDWDGPRYMGAHMAVVQPDGHFTLMQVPAGRYTLLARRRLPPASKIGMTPDGTPVMPMDDVISRDETAAWARLPLAVGDEPTRGLAITLVAGTEIRGRVEVDAAPDRPVPRASRMVSFESVGGDIADGPVAQVRDGETFTVRAVPGHYTIDPDRLAAPGWLLRSVTINGRDVGIGPFEVGAEVLSDVVITLTNRLASISGDVLGGAAAPDASVIIFPVDPEAWANQPSRLRSNAQRPWRVLVQRAKAGRFAFNGVLPGEYFVVAIDDAAIPQMLPAAFLQRVARVATRVDLAAGEARAVTLPVRKP